VADYASLGLTLGRHPLALLRNRLTKQRMISAADIRTLPDGKLVRTTGLVTCRQRPGTASGVTFVTLEDETGMINVIVWPKLAERQRRELLASSLLGVYGVLQRAGDVIHVIAAKLENQSPLLGRLLPVCAIFIRCSGSMGGSSCGGCRSGAGSRLYRRRAQRPHPARVSQYFDLLCFCMYN
jgi:error-prone DNA polymerase